MYFGQVAAKLPTLSKVLEKILNHQLGLYFQKNNIIPENQSGFSRGRSCNTALQNITDDIIGAIDQGKLTVLILLDYSRAFDTLNHEILKSMYGYAGFSNEATTLLTNYLHNRVLAVYYGGKLSNFESTNNGVPQGTILGPRMYTFYTSTRTHFYLVTVIIMRTIHKCIYLFISKRPLRQWQP